MASSGGPLLSLDGGYDASVKLAQGLLSRGSCCLVICPSTTESASDFELTVGCFFIEGR